MVRHAIRAASLVAAALLVAPSALSQPQVAITRAPTGIMQVLGGPVENDSFTIGNGGTDLVTITLVPSAGFFSLSTTSFVLPPRRSQAITIRPVATDGGLYEGSVTVSVAGANRSLSVPVRMFIGQQPFGSVNPGLGSNFIILSGRAGQQHAGALNVSNFGNAIMTCMLVSSVPWIVPPREIVGVEPRATKNFAFEVNPSLRPDGTAPLGALIGTLTMLNIRGTSGETFIAQAGVTTATVIDITKASVVPQQPLPLAAGEVASFLAGITDNFATSHVFLSNRTASVLSGVQLFYSSAGAGSSTALLAALGQFPAASSAWFPYAPASLFEVSDQTGSIQMRTLQTGQVSLSALLAVVPDNQNLYLTALPVLTSTAAAAPGETLLYSGVEKSDAVSTDLHIQETAGAAGSFTVDFFDAAGAAIPPARNEPIQPFGYVPLANVVPAGARSVRVTNASGSNARLAGYAAVVDAATRDRWTIVDSRRSGAPSEVFVPMPSLSGAGTLEISVTNGTTGAAAVTLATSSSPGRRRAVRRGTASSLRTEETSIVESFTLAPFETRRVTVADNPQRHIRVAGPAGALSVSGRLTGTAPGRAGSFGTGIPALPASAASTLGGRKQFALADDQPGVSPPALLLLETAGKETTVRATLRFSFPGGSTATGNAAATKDYPIPAGQLLTIPDLIRSILGPSRDELGRLFKVTVEAEVIAGDGRVLTYLQRTDVSGDVTLFVD